jgi:hypothetical protein
MRRALERGGRRHGRTRYLVLAGVLVALLTSACALPQGGRGPAYSSRDPRVWPFAANAPWNTPRGDGATFDPRPVIPGPFNISAANGYGVSVGGAGYGLVNQPGGEGHYSMYRGDGVTVDEYYGYNPGTGGSKNHMVTDARGSGVGVGWDTATQTSQLGGLIRSWDLQQPAIPHALQFGCATTVLNSQFTWPAKSVDGYAGSNQGWVPYGALFAIPSNMPMPAGMSAAGQKIWTALRNYGGYCVDGQGPIGSGTQNFSSLRAEASADGAVAPARADLARIGPQLRWVTNNSIFTVGGPGNRLAPTAPAI